MLTSTYLGMCRCEISSLTVPLSCTNHRHGNILVTNFMDLPDKRENPDYYEKISKPIDITTVMVRSETIRG